MKKYRLLDQVRQIGVQDRTLSGKRSSFRQLRRQVRGQTIWHDSMSTSHLLLEQLRGSIWGVVMRKHKWSDLVAPIRRGGSMGDFSLWKITVEMYETRLLSLRRNVRSRLERAVWNEKA